MKTRHLVVAALVAVLAVTGCKKDNKDGGAATAPAPTAGSATGSAAADPAPAPAPTPAPAGGSAAAADPAPAPAGGGGAALSDAEIEDLIKAMVAFVSDIGASAKGGDCAAAATGITAAVDKHKPFLDKFAKYKDDKSLEERAEKILEDKGYEKQMDEAMKPFVELGQKCGEDPAFKAAAEKFMMAMD
jgi:hypothetical protein